MQSAYWAPDHLATKVVNKSLHDVIPTAAYLSTKGRRLDPLLRRYLDSLLTAPFTFFEVLACNPGTGMTLRDVMTQEEHAVTERAASRGVQPGDLLFGQLASVDRLTMLEASNGFAISPMEKAPIIELRAQIASAHPVITHQVLRDWDFELLDLFHEIADRAYNPQLPILQNTDGDPLSLHKLVFDLKAPPQAAFDALMHLALDELDEDLLADATRDSEGKATGVRFTWKKPHFETLQCCESPAEERGAVNLHATFCGNRRRATASGDPVGGVARRPPIPINTQCC